jgi:hypothetical protein
MTGPVSAITGASFSGGASYADLWYRPPSRDLKPDQYANDLLAQIAGANVAVPLSMAQGATMAMDGHVERAFEHFLPPAAGNVAKTIRYANEGVTNLRGETIVPKEDLSSLDLIYQLGGLPPQKVEDAYRWENSQKNLQGALADRHAQLFDRYYEALKKSDPDAESKAIEQAQAEYAARLHQTRADIAALLAALQSDQLLLQAGQQRAASLSRLAADYRLAQAQGAVTRLVADNAQLAALDSQLKTLELQQASREERIGLSLLTGEPFP